LLILNRSMERARTLATQLRGEPLALSSLAEHLPEADIVICATGAPEPLINKDLARSAMKHRSGNNMLIVDIGVPRNVAADVAQIDNLILNNVDGLQAMIDQNIERRRYQVPRVEEIIAEEVDRFLSWHSGLQVGPVIRELQESLKNLRDQEVGRLRNLTPEQRAAVEQVAHGLIQKLLHRPMSLLREATEQGETGLRRIQTIREIFGLESAGNDTGNGSRTVPGNDNENEGKNK